MSFVGCGLLFAVCSVCVVLLSALACLLRVVFLFLCAGCNCEKMLVVCCFLCVVLVCVACCVLAAGCSTSVVVRCLLSVTWCLLLVVYG